MKYILMLLTFSGIACSSLSRQEPDLKAINDKKTMSESHAGVRSVASNNQYEFSPYCSEDGKRVPQFTEIRPYDTCEVFNITHYTGQTIIELENCHKGCSISLRVNSKVRESDFVLQQLFNLYNTRKAAGKVTQATVNMVRGEISQVTWGYVNPDSSWRDH